MQETLFERYLAESERKVAELQGIQTTSLDILEAFFPRKAAKQVDKYHPCKNQKNAVILVGPSCCGKSTYAREFIKRRPFFKLVSMDECAIDDLENMNVIDLFLMMNGRDTASPDDLGNRRFGRMLEKGYRNIIIDGCWLHVNSRGALLRTLEDLGYHTCLFICEIDEEVHSDRIRRRSCEIVASRRLLEAPTQTLRKAESLKMYAKKMRMSETRVIKKIEGTREFHNCFMQEREKILAEMINANYSEQFPSYAIFFGADELYELRDM